VRDASKRRYVPCRFRSQCSSWMRFSWDAGSPESSYTDSSSSSNRKHFPQKQHCPSLNKMGDTAVGVSVPVFGICSPDFGCSCECHDICGSETHLDMVVRFKSVIVEGGTCVSSSLLGMMMLLWFHPPSLFFCLSHMFSF
jgi:hypothetical protein